MVDKQAVTLVGAGLVGSLAAILLARRGHRVDVYEGRLDPRKLSPPPGRSVALVISARGWKTLRAAGLEEAVRQACIPLRGRWSTARIGSRRSTRMEPMVRPSTACPARWKR